MSYRVKVNGCQIFGNHERYVEWDDFIRSQGIEIDEEGCYDGEIADFMGALIAVENIVLKLEKERRERAKKFEEETKNLSDEDQKLARAMVYRIKSIFDLSHIPNKLEKEDPEDRFRASLFDELSECIRSGYAFMPYALYMACQDKLEQDNCFAVEGHFECFKLKEGETINVSAS